MECTNSLKPNITNQLSFQDKSEPNPHSGTPEIKKAPKCLIFKSKMLFEFFRLLSSVFRLLSSVFRLPSSFYLINIQNDVINTIEGNPISFGGLTQRLINRSID